MIRLVHPFSAADHELLYRVMAAHEAGHQTMFLRFGVQSEASVEFDLAGDIAGAVTVPQAGCLSDFQQACVGWGGILGEYLLGFILQPTRELPVLTAQSVVEWCRALWRDFRYSGLSDADRAMIGQYLGPGEPARFTFQTLSGPVGSTHLYRKFNALIEAFRGEHASVLERNGTAAPSAVRSLSRRLFEATGDGGAQAAAAGVCSV